MTDETKWAPMDAEWVSELQARAQLDPVLRFELYCVFELGRSRGWSQAMREAPDDVLFVNPWSLSSMEAFVANHPAF